MGLHFTPEEEAEFKKDLKKVKWVFIIFFSLLFIAMFYKGCEYNKDVSGLYPNQKQVVKVIADERQKIVDSLNAEIQQRDIATQQLMFINDRLESQVASIKSTVKVIHVPVYKTGKTVIDYSKVNDLSDCKKLITVIPIQDSIITNQDSIIKNLGKDKENFKTQVIFAEQEIKERKKLDSLANQEIRNLSKQLKSQKRMKWIAGATTVLSFIIGVKLAK